MVLQLEKALQERAVELDSIRDENRRLHAQLQQAQTGTHTPPHSPPLFQGNLNHSSLRPLSDTWLCLACRARDRACGGAPSRVGGGEQARRGGVAVQAGRHGQQARGLGRGQGAGRYVAHRSTLSISTEDQGHTLNHIGQI